MKRIDDPIEFQPTGDDAAEFVHELTDPSLVRAGVLTPEVAAELRRQQALRLRRNVDLLRVKQREFHRRIEEYVANLEKLIDALDVPEVASADDSMTAPAPGRSSLAAPPESESESASASASASASESAAGTLVHCDRCGAERRFDGIRVIYARESEDAFDRPTECYVSDGGDLRKGIFTCRSCGSDALLIRA